MAAENAGIIAKQGGVVVERTVKGIENIAEIVVSAANTIEELGKSSTEIGEIVKVIEEIADQTDIQVMILTENMSAFSNDDNISDSTNITDITDTSVMNQLLVGSQVQ